MLHPYPDPPPGGEPTPPAPAPDPVVAPLVSVPEPVVATPQPIIPPTQVPAQPVVVQPEPVIPEPVVDPPVVVQPEPEPEPELGVNLSDKVREGLTKQANYYSRKPDEMEFFLKELEDATGSSVINSISSDVTEMRLELAREKAMRKHALDETDMQFVQGSTPESIMKSAVAFKAMKDGLVVTPAAPIDPAAPVATPNGTPVPVVTPTEPVVTTPAPALPEYTSANAPVTLEQAEADFAESFMAEAEAEKKRLGIP